MRGVEEAENVQWLSSKDDHIALRDLDVNHKGVKMYKKLTEELENVNRGIKKFLIM